MASASALVPEIVAPDTARPHWQFPAGVSGNPKGRPKKGDAFAEMLRSELERVHPIEEKLAKQQGREAVSTRQLLINKLIAKALGGDLPSMSLLLTRAYGKPPAQLQVQGEVNHTGTVGHEHEHEFSIDTLGQKLGQLREARRVKAAEAAE